MTSVRFNVLCFNSSILLPEIEPTPQFKDSDGQNSVHMGNIIRIILYGLFIGLIGNLSAIAFKRIALFFQGS